MKSVNSVGKYDEYIVHLSPVATFVCEHLNVEKTQLFTDLFLPFLSQSIIFYQPILFTLLHSLS